MKEKLSKYVKNYERKEGDEDTKKQTEKKDEEDKVDGTQ